MYKPTIQQLIDKLMLEEDKNLPVAVRECVDEYWGDLFGLPWVAEVRSLQVHGPKKPPVTCFYIGQD